MTLLLVATSFMSAFLLFLIQPMFGKMILPFAGGSPAVWNTCMLFFQTILLAGYAYVHVITGRFTFRFQHYLHQGLILIPLSILPIGLASGWTVKSQENPIPSLLGLLTVSIGLPFFVLSTTAPLLQKWFSNTNHPDARDPYFMYAASNLGSIVAILGYPVVIEPYLDLKGKIWCSQSRLWSIAYLLFTVLNLLCIWKIRQSTSNSGSWKEERCKATPDHLNFSSEFPGSLIQTLLRWIALAFVPSSLMLGVTSYITLNIASIPLFWVVPLAVYLISFILVFAKWPGQFHKALVYMLPFALLLVVFSMSPSSMEIRFWAIILIHLLGLFLVATVCHGELARTRPPAKYLTIFYLILSLGGVLGGIFNAIIAPMVFNGTIEYQITLVIAGLLSPSINQNHQLRAHRLPFIKKESFLGLFKDLIWATILAIITIVLLWINVSLGNLSDLLFPFTNMQLSKIFSILAYGIPIFICSLFVGQPLRFGLGLGVLILATSYFLNLNGNILLHQKRTFFGVLKVKLDPEENIHKLIHGTTLHGEQSLDPDRLREALSYYHLTGPIGQMLNAYKDQPTKRDFAVIGLGSGTLATYMERGQSLTFYEIDPELLRIAQNRNFFTYFDDCQKRGVNLKVILGDARVSLQQAENKIYDVIILDAFSSDAIPIHLITREALVLYFNKLKPDGILAVHISNRYLNLEPVLGNLKNDLHLVALNQADGEDDDFPEKSKSHWVLLASQINSLDRLKGDPRWTALETDPKVGVWTDNFSNIISVFKWHSSLR